ncbi:MAG: DUF4179 domain-containing protein [Oscillospiraceae bacterium]|nr:DUF4179 domain-containing protein [Oscillospiraceae bacterium]
MFSETYRKMNDAVVPSPALIEQTLAKAKRRRFPLRRIAAIAAAAALCAATPALAAQTELGYQALYLIAPAAAQFFQPVQRSCTDNGVIMEVAAVRVEGSAAQAYITLTGDTVDGTTDLFDSYDFHLPFDQIGHCERVGYDEATHTATFLCTTETMDGSPIPTGGKMTFSVRRFLSGREEVEDLAVDLRLADYAREAETAPSWSYPSEKTDGAFCRTGGSYSAEEDEALYQTAPILLPGEALAEPVPGLSVTAAGWADGLLHIQLCRGNAARLDNHGWLWLEDAGGNRVEPRCSIGFHNDAETETDGRLDYTDFLFDVSPAELSKYTLHGDFYTASTRTEGRWRVTFPLVNES